MRVTANTFPTSLVDQLSRLANRQYKLQNQAATGQRISLPEDDPTAMRRVLDMQTEANSLAQYRRNIGRLQEVAAASFSSTKAIKSVSDRASEIAVLADDLKSPAELTVLADEVNELIKQALQVANSENRGDSLFAGTRTNVASFVATTDSNSWVTAVNYQGNTTLSESEISASVTLTGQTIGANTSGAGPRGLITDSRVGADLFNHLIALRDHLAAGDIAGVQADGDDLAADEENLLYHLGTNGAIQARLEAGLAVAITRSEALADLISKEADADLAQTVVQLTTIQTAYQAALQSGGTVLNASLLDYIR